MKCIQSGCKNLAVSGAYCSAHLPASGEHTRAKREPLIERFEKEKQDRSDRQKNRSDW